MAKVLISAAQLASLKQALYDLNNSDAEVAVLRAAGVDTMELENVRDDLRKNLMAYLTYAQNQPKSL